MSDLKAQTTAEEAYSAAYRARFISSECGKREVCSARTNLPPSSPYIPLKKSARDTYKDFFRREDDDGRQTAVCYLWRALRRVAKIASRISN
jgi:hypothetical protein